jgi:hypothetical protein
MTTQWRVWSGRKGTRIGWFRFLGYGLAWRDHGCYPPMFSERYNGQHGIPRRRYLHLGRWCFLVTTWRHP